MADEKQYESSTSELQRYICLAMNEVDAERRHARRGRIIRGICSRNCDVRIARLALNGA